MKQLELTWEEYRTLRKLGVFHSHSRTQLRAQEMFRLSQSPTLQKTANELGVRLNSVE